MKSTTSWRNERLPLRERLDLALLDDLDDLLLDRLADPLELLRTAVERELRDRAGRVAHPRRRPPVGDHPERLGPFELQQVGEELELLRDLRVLRQRRPRRRSYARPSVRSASAGRDHLPPHVQRAGEPRVHAPRARSARRERARRRRQLARRHRRDRRPARRRARIRLGAAPRPRSRASAPRTSPASAAPSPTAPTTSSRWTATSRTSRRTFRA